MKNLKSDFIKYGDNKVLRVDYIKSIKGNGKVYVDVAFFGEDAQKVDKLTNSRYTGRFYGNKEHAQSIVIPSLKSVIKKMQRKNIEMDIKDAKNIEAYRDIYITSLGEENIYFEMDNKLYYVKGKKWDVNFETPKWVTASEFKKLLE